MSLDAEVIDLPHVPIFVSQGSNDAKRVVAASLLRLIERRGDDDATLSSIDRDERGIIQLVRDFGGDERPERDILADCNLAAALLTQHRPVAEHLALSLLGGHL
jgi:hypothetical protein